MATKGKITVNFALRFVAAISKNRYVALPLRYSTIAYKDIVYYAAKAAHVPESSIEVAMDALYDALSYFVLNGHNVKIDGLGTFAFGINAYAQDDISAAGADAVHNMKVMYLAEMSLRQMLNNVAITTQITNPNGLPVDDSALAEVTEILYRVGNSMNWRKASFGAQVAVPAEGITLRISGVRMSRSSVSAMIFGSASIHSDISDRSAKSLEYVITRASDTATYIEAITVSDGATEIASRHYSVPGATDAFINQLLMNGIDVTTKPSPVAVVSADPNLLNIYGANMQSMNATFTNCTATLQSSSAAMLQYRITAVTGNVVMTCNDSDMTTKTFVFSGTGGGSSSSSAPIVTSLSANGISVANGGSSTVQAGQSYNFVFAGANLSGVRQSDLIVPTGASISNFAASANQVSFTLTIGSVGGTIGIRVNGATAFSVSVSIPSDIAATITNIEGVSNNGSKTVEISDDNRRATFAINGSGLDTLTDANIVFSGANVTLNEGTESHRLATLQFSSSPSDGPLRVQIDGTTIFTLNITWDVMM